MKQVVFPALLFLALLFSCEDNSADKKVNSTIKAAAAANGITSNSEAGKTGRFSFDGKEVRAEVTTQYFGSDKEKSNFSVLCQHNEGDAANPDFELLQVTFINEKDANTNPALKIYDGGSMLPMTEPEPGIVSVVLSGVGSGFNSKQFTGTEKSTGSIAVKNRIVAIKNLVLLNSDGEKRVVNAVLPF